MMKYLLMQQVSVGHSSEMLSRSSPLPFERATHAALFWTQLRQRILNQTTFGLNLDRWILKRRCRQIVIINTIWNWMMRLRKKTEGLRPGGSLNNSSHFQWRSCIHPSPASSPGAMERTTETCTARETPKKKGHRWAQPGPPNRNNLGAA